MERVTLSGGEPLLRKGWDRIARKLMERGVSTSIISNGWYLAENISKNKRIRADKINRKMNRQRFVV